MDEQVNRSTSMPVVDEKVSSARVRVPLDAAVEVWKLRSRSVAAVVAGRGEVLRVSCRVLFAGCFTGTAAALVNGGEGTAEGRDFVGERGAEGFADEKDEETSESDNCGLKARTALDTTSRGGLADVTAASFTSSFSKQTPARSALERASLTTLLGGCNVVSAATSGSRSGARVDEA